MIPKIIHQIWIGSKNPPTKGTDPIAESLKPIKPSDIYAGKNIPSAESVLPISTIKIVSVNAGNKNIYGIEKTNDINVKTKRE